MKILFYSAILFSSLSFAKTPVWVDYDICYGRIIRDVDDGFALITALQSKELDVLGVSYGFGNISNLNYMDRISHKILRKLDRQDVKVFAGAKNQSEIFKNTDATRAMADALREHDQLTIMAMGRLTNVASLIKNYPSLTANIKEIVINAGRRLEYETKVGRQQVIMPDTNVDDHLEAMRYVLESGVKIVMMPVEVMQDKFVTRHHLRQMRRGNRVSRWMARNSIVWRWIWKFFPNSPGFIPWDVFIVTYVTSPEAFDCDDNIKIDLKYLKNNTSSLFRKKYKKKFKYFLVASDSLESEYTGKYCYKMAGDHLDNIVDNWSVKEPKL